MLQAVEPAHDRLHAVLVYALAMSSLTELRLRETGSERKCIQPLRNDFGSNALIVAVLLRSSEAGSYSAAAVINNREGRASTLREKPGCAS